MAGAILLGMGNGLSLKSVDFDYIMEKIRLNFREAESAIREEIYSPADDGGLSFISLEEQDSDGFNAFVRAAASAYEQELKDQPLSSQRFSWGELMNALESDPRAKKT